MKIPAPYAHGTLRFSISRDTTPAEIDGAVEILAACVQRLGKSWKGSPG
jgi:cysteine sulfinate desulfinase/cysteine desulfurase-like protein